MNAETGQIYELGSDVFGDGEIGQKLKRDEVDAQLADLKRTLSTEEMAAAVDLARGDTIVRVGEEAAQRARLGDRELRRRRQRRR